MNELKNSILDTKQPNRRFFLHTLLGIGAATILAKEISGNQQDEKNKILPADIQTTAELKIQRLTWAGIKLEIPSETLFIDPLMNTDIWEGAWKQPVAPVESTTSERNVVITHAHNDHFDQTLIKKLLAERGSVICHEGIAELISSRGFRVRSVKLYEPLLQGNFTITPVPAVDGVNDGQVSWVIAAGGKKIIHCGDTLWHGAWWHIGKQLGPFDAAFLPINGAQLLTRTPPSGIPIDMNPEQAVAAAIILGAKLAVPIHYGFPGSSSYIEIPNAEALFIEAAKKRNLDIEVIQPGGWVKWKN